MFRVEGLLTQFNVSYETLNWVFYFVIQYFNNKLHDYLGKIIITGIVLYAAMVKWYNGSLPRISRGFDYPWPHKENDPEGSFLTATRRKTPPCLS